MTAQQQIDNTIIQVMTKALDELASPMAGIETPATADNLQGEPAV